MISTFRRAEPLKLLESESRLLSVAREVSEILAAAGVDAAIIGGVAVVLHGHVRTTADVDVFVAGDLANAATALESAGFRFDKRRREFVRDEIPIQLVRSEELGSEPTRRVTIDDITTVSLPDLVAMKIRSGSRSVARAQDLADVVGLIRVRKLPSSFVARLPRDVRGDFRKIWKAVAAERS